MTKFVVFSLLFLCALLGISSYKIAVFTPQVSNSQVIYSKRVAETLANAGHDVTVILTALYSEFDPSDVKFADNVKLYYVDGANGVSKKDMEKMHSETIFRDFQIWDPQIRKQMSFMTGLMTSSSRKIVQNKEFRDWLIKEKFDLAFTHVIQTWPIGFIHYAKIPAWIWYSSGSLPHFIANTLGVPLIPSYVPPMAMAAHDQMSFYERIKSVLGHAIFTIMWPRMVPAVETQIFREEIDPNFPDLLELAKKCPLITVNTNVLYDLPRPTLAKVINIGGLGVQVKDAKPLTEKFAQIANKGKPMIVFSFGSIAPTQFMPIEWKRALMSAFGRWNQYEFLLRYTSDDINDIKPGNVHLFKWLPQSDLLQHNQTKAFISHGGYNSMQETINAGKPMITVALFGDQPKNAKIALKIGIAVNLEKSEITEEAIYNAVKEITENPKYTDNAVRLRRMVQQGPVNAETLLVKWAEFVAEFKTLENLEPAGQHLNFFQYHSIDVLLFLGTIVFIVLLVIFLVSRFVFRKMCTLCSYAKRKIE